MQTQVQKWGNSLGVRIPKNLAKKLYFKEGAVVNLQISDNHLVISQEISELEILLDGISDENCHHEILSQAKKAGNESW